MIRAIVAAIVLAAIDHHLHMHRPPDAHPDAYRIYDRSHGDVPWFETNIDALGADTEVKS